MKCAHHVLKGERPNVNAEQKTEMRKIVEENRKEKNERGKGKNERGKETEKDKGKKTDETWKDILVKSTETDFET